MRREPRHNRGNANHARAHLCGRCFVGAGLFGGVCFGRRQEHGGFEAEEVFGKFVGATVAQDALDHAHFGVEVVHHRDEDGFRRGSHCGGTPFQFALVAEDDVFEAFEERGVEFVFQTVFASKLVTEDDVAVEDASA